MAANKETVCSFQEIVGGHCSFQTKDRSKSVEVLPLLQCKRNIGAHKSAPALTGVENEDDLILSRASMLAPPRNVEKLNICPRHRESLGLGWRRPSSKCSAIPNVLSSHSAKPRDDKLRKEIEGQNFNTSMGGKAGNSNRKSLLSSVQSFIYKCPISK